MMPNILVITPVRHIQGVTAILEEIGEVTYLDDPTPGEAEKAIGSHHAVFTNPNKSKVFIGHAMMDAGSELRVICTASTGTNHIDTVYAVQCGVHVISLTEEHEVINKISCTAEHAFALALAAIRHIPQSFDSVKRGEWNYEPYVGRQMDHLTVGVVGFGRLGSYFARYANAMGSKVLVHDPYVTVTDPAVTQVEKTELLNQSDIISFHVHVTEETMGMVDHSWFHRMKNNVVLVNTARGELMEERDLITFLQTNPGAVLATDVVAHEVTAREKSPLLAYAKEAKNIIVTPHIGGMTFEGQEIAFRHAANLLKGFFQAGQWWGYK